MSTNKTLTEIVRAAASRFNQRPLYRASVEARAEIQIRAITPPVPHPYLTHRARWPYYRGMNSKTNNTDGLKHTTLTAIAISDAAMAACGDFAATARALARFCTEALIDAAISVYVPAKFSSDFPTYRTPTRDEAIARLAGWVSYTRVMAWSDAARAERAYSDSFVPSEDVS